jgi:hypothetical protein
MPTTKEITEQILSGKNVGPHTNGIYYLNWQTPWYQDNQLEKVLKFLKILKIEIDSYYKEDKHRETNYEDLYYLASQIMDSETWEYDNPAIQALIDKLKADSQLSDLNIEEIARESCNYICDIVIGMLKKDINTVAHLNFLKDAYKDSDLKSLYLFTLNHDLILEKYLELKKIKYVDGFGKKINNIRYWEPSLFDNDNNKIFLLKLHGSVNLFRTSLQINNHLLEDKDRYCLIYNNSLLNLKGPSGEPLHPNDWKPIILTGTFNKMYDYTRSPFLELYYRFYKFLNKTNKLIVIGYSFSDRGIHNQIAIWLSLSKENNLIIVHPNLDELYYSARGAIRRKWKMFEFINKKIEQITWQDIKGKISKE